MTPTESGHWSDISQKWSHVGPPLRPSPEDIAVFQAIVREAAPKAPLLLGVTPELYTLEWPFPDSLIAADHTLKMIDSVWQGGRNRAVLGDWRDLPLQVASRDMAVCDGGFHLNDYPNGQRKVAESLKRVLTPGGVFAVRLFVPPSQAEEPESVLSELLAGIIPNLNILKVRLGMSMQESASMGVRLDQVWRTISGLAASIEELATKLGWPLEHLMAIESYRGSTARYCFSSVDDIAEIFCEDVAGFELSQLTYPKYELGERFPIAVFHRI